MEISNQQYMETEHSSQLTYERFKWQAGHRNSIDSGYESLLSTSSLSYSCSLTSNSSTSSSVVASQPSTPLKTAAAASGGFIMSSNNTTTTPDLRQKYIADVNSMYLASIRADSGFASPIKGAYSSSSTSSSFGNYSASCSNSPVIHSGVKSPKFEYESYINQRDNFNSKLLKSPAFKLNPTVTNRATPAVVIKSFSTRLQLNLSPPASEPQKEKELERRVTPTEEEFLQMLIRNRHIPANPDSLIGRHMGVEKLNIVGELWKRSMNNVLDAIFGYLDVRDLVRVGCVSNEWRAVLKENKKLYKQRTEFIRQRRIQCETFKENRVFAPPAACVSHNDFDMEMTETTPVTAWPYAKLSLEEKRNILNKHRAQVSLELNKQHDDRAANNIANSHNLHRASNGNFVFASLDLNCLNNYASQSSVLTDQFVQATDSLSLTRTVNQSKKAAICDHDTTATLAKFICKNLKVSPSKSHTSPSKRDQLAPTANSQSPVSTAPSKIDLIGSKKSRKNLKRL